MKKGDVLVAIDPCRSKIPNQDALTVGNQYPIIEANDYSVQIIDDQNIGHWFSRDRVSDFFTDDDLFQSLFSFMHQEHGLTLTNGQMWDIVNEVEKLKIKL